MNLGSLWNPLDHVVYRTRRNPSSPIAIEGTRQLCGSLEIYGSSTQLTPELVGVARGIILLATLRTYLTNVF